MTSKLWLLLLCLAQLGLKEHVRAETTTPSTGLQNLLKFNLTPAAANDSCAYFNLYKYLFEEMDSQNHPMIQAYYNRVVQKLYETVPANILFLQLWQIYNKCDPSTFVAMVRSQLSLFWLHNMNEYPDHDYLLMVANGLYKIKSYYLYNSLNSRTHLLFDRAVKSLPNSLHHLFGHQEFCLMNRKHQEMLYQTSSDEFVTNHEIRFGFTWHFMKRYNDGKGKIKPIFEDFNMTSYSDDEEELVGGNETRDLVNIPASLSIALYNKHFKNFYARWPVYDQKIGGNLSGIPEFIWQQDYHLWSVKVVDDDHLVFFQNQYIMCATSFYDNKRRFVFGVKNRSMLDTECQWSAGNCDRRQV
ncbi:uncharacterized protein LOC135957878 [Calliphora vicina]|uniref:uncharacterized protein LOC135957878 n=1 Tax=Calliphora vicina TaxID=7373 RepID=UPI00325C322F